MSFWDRLRSFRLYGLQTKLILPYLILTLILASGGIFIATYLVVENESVRFHNSVLDASRVANDSIVLQERTQLDRLRLVIFSDGMNKAVFDKDAATIFEKMRSLLNPLQGVDLLTALDNQGKEIVSLGREAASNNFRVQQGVDFSGVASVHRILNGEIDQQGDKFVDLIKLPQGAILFTSAPVRDSSNQLLGVMLVGSYVDTTLDRIKKQALADIVVVDLQGNTISTTLDSSGVGFQQLLDLSRTLDPNQPAQTRQVALNYRPYEVVYSPLVIRSQQVGWIGVLKPSDYLTGPLAQSRILLTLLFGVGTIAVVIIGYLLAQNIAKPLLRLRNMSQAVAAGNLNQSSRLKRKDEIGDLARAFDTMTLHLRERTEEAKRLYAESQQRNKELAEINARLEATQLQLIQSEKLASIGQLTAGIVHDVKNPFAVIMGMSEVLAEDEHMDEATRHGLKVIRESAVKGNNIVSDLLKFARQSKPEMHTTDLRETVQTAARLTAYLTRRYNVTGELPEAPLMVTYDAQQIEQVLINLIHNAVQAMPNGGSLHISLKGAGGQAAISVRDSGCGIPPENMKRIFDPFFTTKPEGEGTGLGLSVSYGIVANHHGRIAVESEVGKGSTFTVTLPIVQPTTNSGETN